MSADGLEGVASPTTETIELTGVDSHHECSGVPGAAPSNSLARAPGSCRLEKLPYPDATFDAVTAACVFCSVPDRVEGLREAAGVTRPRGLILLHEHRTADESSAGVPR